MDKVLRLTSKSELPFILAFCCISLILWLVALKSLVSGEFFDNPSPIFFLVGCVTAFFARMFYRNGQAYVLLDSNGDGQVETEAGMIFRKKIYLSKGLRDVIEMHVYHRRVTTTENYYPCLLFNDGFELWLPQGEHIAEPVVKWFKEQYGIEMEVITHRNADTKDILQKEKAGRCYPKE